MNYKWINDLTASGILKILYSDINKFITNVLMIYNIILIKIDLKFKKKLIINYIKNQFLQNLLPVLE